MSLVVINRSSHSKGLDTTRHKLLFRTYVMPTNYLVVRQRLVDEYTESRKFFGCIF
jgi:hypothetical protein